MYSQSSSNILLEKELLLLLKQGDEQAFESIYRLYSLRILQKLIRLLKDEEIAKELLQDIFLKIWEKREFLNPDRSFSAYLFRITENQVTDLFRRAAFEKKLMAHLIRVSTELYNHTEEFINFKEGNAILQQAIDTLPPQRKKIFTLCKIEGKSYEEAGKLLGISSGTVNDHMVKAARTVKKHFSHRDMALIGLLTEFITQ
jgi:RNA polymerase sigma-70 factor (family 1)